jgi:hypothetical protein
MKHYFSFDVEAMGLLGNPFAVGWVVVDEEGDEKEEGYLACPHPLKDVASSDLQWMKENVLPHLPEPNCDDPPDLYQQFWDVWKSAEANYEDVVMVSDVPFPVEAGFLIKCLKMLGLGINDSPYPLLDVASVILATGGDPLNEAERRDNEKPAHHPTNDARQSARLLVEALGGLADLSPPE